MRFIVAVSVSLVVVIVTPLLFVYNTGDSFTGNATYGPENRSQYILGNYTINPIDNQTVIVSSQGISLTVNVSAFFDLGGKFTNEPLKSSKINRIDDSVQNSVAFIDQFQHAKMTFIFDLAGNSIDITIVNSGVSTYLSMNFSTGVPLGADSSGIFSGGGTFGPQNYGHNVLSDNTAYFQESTATGFFTLNWMQITAINKFDYGTFAVSNGQSSLNIVFGPFGNVGENYGPIILSVNG